MKTPAVILLHLFAGLLAYCLLGVLLFRLFSVVLYVPEPLSKSHLLGLSAYILLPATGLICILLGGRWNRVLGSVYLLLWAGAWMVTLYG